MQYGMSLTTSWDGAYFGLHAPIDGNDIAVEITPVAPVGDWGEWFPFGNIEKRVRPGKSTFTALRDFVVPEKSNGFIPDLPPGKEVKAGETFTMTRPAYFSEYRGELPGHDYCSYCGADNGFAGSYRQGWDCCYCGGN